MYDQWAVKDMHPKLTGKDELIAWQETAIKYQNENDRLQEELDVVTPIINGQMLTLKGLREELALAVEALIYCQSDDVMAVTPEDEFDVQSANEWKKLKAREALAKIRGKHGI